MIIIGLGSVFLTAMVFQLIYLIFIYGRLAFFFRPANKAIVVDLEMEPVTIIIAARNEKENLEKLIPLLEEQDYPSFEIMIVNDRSKDGTSELLENFMGRFRNLRTVTITYLPRHVTAKKYAITLGIKVAKNDVILLTDADCTPVSKNWIKLMTAPVRQQKKAFAIGYGAYRKLPGILNKMIQFDTLFTALQYMSFGLWKAPYMAVGRNLSYRKSFFMEKKAFNGLWHIEGGDDDLYINKYATGKNTSFVIDPESITVSEPKTTYQDYNKQKKRHYHAGKYYKTIDKLKIGLFALSHLLFWLSGAALIFFSQDWRIYVVVGILMIFRILLVYKVFRGAKENLEGKNKVWWTIFFDFMYLGYFWFMGTKGYLSKEVKWK
ncbi:glycosyltransferase [Anditalea andensis]|uniref:Beta-lactamase regulatory protein n=1 Tax=Anditalea andensis TaxID=1048983 RepID=A0A074KS35_9BACT|nr:glycosyltransferase [Anditalea andensis]KEO72771.1 beta-lactamase regulatory protein [Anditalea andensis]